jgi:nucleolin
LFSTIEEPAAAAAAPPVEEESKEVVMESIPEEAAEEVTPEEAPAVVVATEETKLYVGNLKFDENKANVRKLFEAYGEITDVFLPLNRETKEGRGFGFVAFKDRASADKAIEELNESTFGERTIYVNVAGEQEKGAPRVKKTRGSPSDKVKLYVGNISFDSTEDDIKDFFKSFGTVYDCFMPTWADSGKPRGFAFISMDPAEAEIAVLNTDGTDFNGRTVTVSKAMAKKEKEERREMGAPGSRSGAARKDVTKIYVGNLSFDSTEDTIRQLFEEYGEVSNVYVPMDYDYDRNRGFAFVTMEASTAERAIGEADGLELDGRTIRVNAAQEKERRSSEGRWNQESEGSYDTNE